MEPSTEITIPDPKQVFIESRQILKQSKSLPVSEQDAVLDRLHSIGDNDYLQRGGVVTKVYELALNSYKTNHREGVIEAMELFTALGFSNSEPVAKVIAQLQEWLSKQPAKKKSGHLHGLKTRTALALAGVTTLLASPGAPLSTTKQPSHEIIPLSSTAQVSLAESWYPTPPPEKKVSIFNELMKSLVEQAQKRRAERSKNDPEYANRVDPELNRDRLNIVLFGYGETYEPPLPSTTIGSPTVLSIDLSNNTIDLISLTHDIRSPEIEEYQKNHGGPIGPTKIDQAYLKGGFEVLGRTIEGATGLSADLQIAINDPALKYLINDVFGGLEIDIPNSFEAMQFPLEGKFLPGRGFTKGQQRLDGVAAMQYMKALKSGKYDREYERNVRKEIVLKSIMAAFEKEVNNPTFFLRFAMFLHNQSGNKNININFEIPEMLQVTSLKGLSQLRNLGSMEAKFGFKLGKSLYIVDEGSGDGGVIWVTASPDERPQQELEKGVYTDKNFAVPRGNPDPYAKNLPADYWNSVRALVKSRLTS